MQYTEAVWLVSQKRPEHIHKHGSVQKLFAIHARSIRPAMAAFLPEFPHGATSSHGSVSRPVIAVQEPSSV